MAIVIRDRVKETTTTTGTGTISMGGAVTGFRAFSSAFTTADQTYYVIEGAGEWEVGKGTLTTGTPWTLSRDTILASSNSGSVVNFSAGTKVVYCDMPASVLMHSRQFMGAMLYKSADLTGQNLTVSTAITFDSEAYDTSGFHSTSVNTSRITIPAGFGINKVRLSGSAHISSIGTAGAAGLYVFKNGAVFQHMPGQRVADQVPATTMLNVCSGAVPVSDGDYFELLVYASADTSVDLLASSTWFAVEVVEATTLG